MVDVTRERDREMRTAAFQQIAALAGAGPSCQWSDLSYGFEYDGARYSLVNQQGIWKPQRMAFVLSVRTGRGSDAEGYTDHERAVQSVLAGSETIAYAFRRGNPEHAQNRYLAEACAAGAPLIYVLALDQGYLATAPVYIAAVNKLTETCELAFGAPDRGPAFGLPDAAERAEGMHFFRERLERALPRSPLRYPRQPPSERRAAEDYQG